VSSARPASSYSKNAIAIKESTFGRCLPRAVSSILDWFSIGKAVDGLPEGFALCPRDALLWGIIASLVAAFGNDPKDLSGACRR